MKFFKLLRKEMREIITLQSLMGILIGVLMFVLLGSVMSDIGEKAGGKSATVAVADLDGSSQSGQAIAVLKDNGYTVNEIKGESDRALLDAADALELNSVIKIPAGYGAGLEAGKAQSIEVIGELKSFSMMANLDSSADNAAELITESVTEQIFKDQAPNLDAGYIKAPVALVSTTVVGDKSAQISSATLASIAMQQSIFIPIVVFILITFATQFNVSAIANEKGDKTLETLLSAPVSRLAVLGAKMTASAVFSLLMAVVYMVGFSSYMGSMMNSMGAGMSTPGADMSAQITGAIQSVNVLSTLGLQLGAAQFALIGIQLFLTISIALVISLILGALAKDLKSAQGLIAPLMFMTLIPYFITMFLDVNSLPLIGQILVYAIPFTHTFTASSNLLFGNNLLFIFGIIYQIIFLAGILFIAVRVFSTDKIFTLTLEFKKKRKTANAE